MIILPSSLTVIHPSALVCSTRPRVSVYGTGAVALLFSGFSRESDYRHYHRAPKGLAYYLVSALRVDLPALIYTYTIQPPIPSGGGRVTSPSPHHAQRQ